MTSDRFASAHEMVREYAELEAKMADPSIHEDQGKARKLGRRYAQLGPVVAGYHAWKSAADDLEAAREMAQEEMKQAKAATEELEQQLQVLLLVGVAAAAMEGQQLGGVHRLHWPGPPTISMWSSSFLPPPGHLTWSVFYFAMQSGIRQSLIICEDGWPESNYFPTQWVHWSDNCGRHRWQVLLR